MKPRQDNEKKDPTERLRRARVRVYLVAFLVDVVSAGWVLAVSAHAQKQLGASSAQLGYLGASFAGAYALGCLSTGSRGDRVGGRRLLLESLAFLAFGVLPLTLAAGYLESIAVLYATNALYALTISLFWPPLMRELALLSPGKTLWRSVGAFNVLWAAGAAVGTYCGPVVYDNLGWTAAHLGLMAVALLALTLTSFHRTARTVAGTEPQPCEIVDEREGRLFLHLGWIANFSATFAMGGVSFVFLYVGKSLGFTLATVALILFAKDAARFAAFACLRAFSTWHYSLAWLVTIQAVGAGALLASGVATAPWQFLLLFPFLGIFSGLAYYSSLFYGLNLRSAEARKSSVHEGILGLGFCLGPLFCGKVGEHVRAWPGSVLVAAASVIFLAVVVEAGLTFLARRGVKG